MTALPTAQEFTDFLDQLISSAYRQSKEAQGETAQDLSAQCEALEATEELWECYSTQRHWLDDRNLAEAYKRLEIAVLRNFKEAEAGERTGYWLVLDRLKTVTA